MASFLNYLKSWKRLPARIEQIASQSEEAGRIAKETRSALGQRINELETRLKNRYERDAVQTMLAPIEAGQITFGESRAILETVAGLDADGPIVEVGTLFGSSTRILALGKDPARPLISVDIYKWNPLGLGPDAHFGLTKRLLEELVESYGVELIRQDKDEFYRDYAGPAPALVFLDADHSYEATLADIRWAKEAGAAVVCGHDYDEEAFPGVCQAVEEEGGLAKRVESFWILKA